MTAARLPRRAPTILRVSPLSALRFTLAAWKDRLEERVLDQLDDGLDGAGLGRVDRPRDVDLRRHLLAGDILEDLRHAGHDLLVELPPRALVAILLRIEGLDVLEQRLHPAAHLAISDPHLS